MATLRSALTVRPGGKAPARRSSAGGPGTCPATSAATPAWLQVRPRPAVGPPARLAAAVLGGLLLLPAAGAAPGNTSAQEVSPAGGASMLGGVIQLQPDRSGADGRERSAGPAASPAAPAGAGPAPLLPAASDPLQPAVSPTVTASPASAAAAAGPGWLDGLHPAPPAGSARTGSAPGEAGTERQRPAAALQAVAASGAGSSWQSGTPAEAPAATGSEGLSVAPGAGSAIPPAEPGVLVPATRDLDSDPTLRPSGASDPAARRDSGQRELVLDRRRRQLMVLENGTPLRRFPVAVGMPGWETPVGRFAVIEMQTNPTWEHPVSGLLIQPGPDNPLGSRWIGFYRDCQGRSGFNGQEHLVVQGCVVAGFHGTPNRSSIGQAASHGCVRLYEEHVRDLFELVRLGTPVTVLP